MGLSIVYGLVAAMEGFIQVESEEGEGTTVSISIPQKVVDASSNMTVKNKDDLFLACFLEPEKYTIPKVRTYYNEMISSIVNGLDIPLRRISTVDELMQLVAKYKLTHLFVGKEEYLEHASELEKIDNSTQIIVVSDEDKLMLPETGQFKLLKKPFYCLPIVNILNTKHDTDDYYHNSNMSCPGVKVLVIDDEPMNLMVADGIFKGYDMEVKTAESGKEALEICSKESFDLIFLDHMMPEMDGIETLKRLRKLQIEHDKTFTIIAFTANAVSGAREMFLEEGFDEFISKPIEEFELQRILRKVLPKAAIVYKDSREKNVGIGSASESLEVLDEKNKNLHTADSDANVKNKQQKYVEEKDITVKKMREKYVASDHTKNVNAEKEHVTADHKKVEKEQIVDNDTEAEKTIISRLENIGLNVSEGLLTCGNDESFYCELLSQYAQESAEKHGDIQKFYEMRNWEDYRIRVHALKSTSKMIGEDELSEMARKAEDAAKKSDISYIEANHNELLDRYRKVTDDIRSILNNESDVVEKETEAGEHILYTKDQFVDALSELRGYFETFEAERAEEFMDKMNEYQWNGTVVEHMLKPIRELVDDFEFEAATKKISDLMESVKGGSM